jgi:hypothetical protein
MAKQCHIKSNSGLTAVSVSSSVSKSAQVRETLDKLWAEVNKKQQRNDRYQAKLDAFMVYFKQSVEQLEQEVCRANEQWILQLVSFVPRKSIKGRQHGALLDWIQEELTILESNPFNPVNTDDLRDAFNEAIVTSIKQDPNSSEVSEEQLEHYRIELSLMLGEKIELSDEELSELIRDPHKAMAYFESVLRHKMDSDYVGDDEYFHGQESPFFHEESDQHDHSYQQHTHNTNNDVATALFNDKQMNRLYRQLAKKLHPDRELNSDKKAEKMDLMQQLSHARDVKDPLTILLFAQQFLPEYQLELNENLTVQLESILRDKVKQLNADYHELRRGDGLSVIIWQRFGGGTKAAREKGLREYRQALEQDVEILMAKCREIKTVKGLQKHLKARLKPLNFTRIPMSELPFDDFPFDMFD